MLAENVAALVVLMEKTTIIMQGLKLFL